MGNKGMKDYKKPQRKNKVATVEDVKQIVKANDKKDVETKTVNAGSVNLLTYKANTGLVYIATDIMSMPQGVKDDTIVGGTNRVGDRVRCKGIQMNYYFALNPQSLTAAPPVWYNCVKVRIILYRTDFPIGISPTLTQAEVLDANYVPNTPTLQPICYDKALVKEVLYDKVKIIEATNPILDPTASAVLPCNGLYHFKKYLKYDKLIRYASGNSTTPNATLKPLYLCVVAEQDQAFPLPSTNDVLLFMTGWTRAFFTDQ